MKKRIRRALTAAFPLFCVLATASAWAQTAPKRDVMELLESMKVKKRPPAADPSFCGPLKRIVEAGEKDKFKSLADNTRPRGVTVALRGTPCASGGDDDVSFVVCKREFSRDSPAGRKAYAEMVAQTQLCLGGKITRKRIDVIPGEERNQFSPVRDGGLPTVSEFILNPGMSISVSYGYKVSLSPAKQGPFKLVSRLALSLTVDLEE